MSLSLPVAVIGAGLAGLSCAQALRAAGVAVQLFDKSRGAGGRMSTRRGEGESGGWQCDHGAQYFTARDPAFRAEVARWQAAGVASAWAPQLAVLGGAGGHRNEAQTERFVGQPQMTAPARWLAAGLPLSLGTTVTALHRDGDAWRLQTAEADELPQRFAAVLLALPAPQARALVAPQAPALAAITEQARMRGCWALMLQFEQPAALPFDAAFVNSGPLRWLARDRSKPGRTGAESWLLHASAAWSEAHLERGAEDVAARLLEAFTALGGPAPAAWTAHRWRYADTEAPLQLGCAWDAALQLGLCGDWLNGGKVEGAWLSGQRLAQALLVQNQRP